MSKHQYITTRSELLAILKAYHSELDINETLRLTRFSYVDTSGTEFCNYTAPDFAKCFNKRFGDTMIAETIMTAGAQSWLIEFYDDVTSGGSPEINPVIDEPTPETPTTPEQETSSLISLTAEPEIVPEDVVVEAVEPEVVDVVSEEAAAVDWEYVAGLGTDKKAKNALEDYAKPFGIDLKKNKTFDNMVIDFKKHMGV